MTRSERRGTREGPSFPLSERRWTELTEVNGRLTLDSACDLRLSGLSGFSGILHAGDQAADIRRIGGRGSGRGHRRGRGDAVPVSGILAVPWFHHVLRPAADVPAARPNV